MARIPIKFNGSELAGITLDLNGLAAIMTPASMKSGVSNDNTLQNGIRMLTQAGNFKMDKRSFTLTINCCGETEAEFINNYSGLCTILKLGRFTISTSITDEMDVIYESCTSFTQYDRGIGKFSLKLTEINPANDTDQDS